MSTFHLIFCMFMLKSFIPKSQSYHYMKIYPLVESQEMSSKKNDVPLPVRIRVAVATGLGAAAAHSKLLAEQEEREIEHLVATIIEAQVG